MIRDTPLALIIWLFMIGLCENRQQPTWILWRRSSERWCTCVCAPHFFFRFALLLSSFYKCRILLVYKWCQTLLVNLERRTISLKWLTEVWLFCCARIDNNRREYWEGELRKMVCMRVCSAFFFSLRFYKMRLVNDDSQTPTELSKR